MTDFSGLRIGQGFDVHPWSSDPTRVLVLGGVTFPEHRGLSGHSDADVVAHACTDAILGACGLGDIGMMFPDTDDAHEGADSVELLAEACKRAGLEGWQVLNVDCTVVVDSPKIAPHREAMIANLSEAVGAPVTVKGKRTEGVEALMQAVQGFASAIVLRK